MATGGGAGCPDQSTPDDVTTPKSVIPADSNSDDETSSALTIGGQGGTEISLVGQGQLMVQNAFAPLNLGSTQNYKYNYIETQHVHHHHSETEDSTENTAWCEFDEAQSLNTQDVSPEDLDRAVELLNHYGRIALCGPPKSGKSSLAHALLKHYMGHGFTAYLVHKLCCHYQLTKGRKGRSIVLMDGSLGVLRVDDDQFNACKDLKNRCYLILTLHPHVLRDLAMLEDQACPLLPPSQSVVIKMEPRHPLSAVDYLPLFQHMLRREEKTLPALFALRMQGSCDLDVNPSEVVQSLQRLGFNKDPYDLIPLANTLTGSILSSTHPGFPSRVEYDAAGLALGHFNAPLLFKVCDGTFLLKHIRTSGTLTKSIMVIGPGEKAYPALVQRMYEMLVDGQMPELCQHPSLGCSDFLRDFQAFCVQRENYEQRLVNAVDRNHGLPLLYWSLWSQTTQLTQWCLTIMTEQISTYNVLSENIVSAVLATVLFAAETGIRSRAQRFLADLTLMNFSPAAAGKLTLTLPLLTEHVTVTADMSAKLCILKTDGVCYLDNHLLAVPTSLLSINVTEGAVSVELSSQHWNLALRLVADRQPDETDDSGDTLLHLAAHAGHLQAIQIAVKSGASITITNKKGQSPYQLAQKRQTVQKKDTSCHDNIKSLHRACKEGDAEAVRVALCYKASVHDKGDNQDTPLHTACRARQAEVASLLIHLGADIESSEKYKCTPLHLACQSGDVDTVRLLLQHGAQVNLKNDNGNTSLHLACIKGHTDVIKLLIQQGAEVNLKNDSGDTPLHMACNGGHTEVTKLLIQQGAEVNLKNGTGCTPLHMACSGGHTEVTKLLIQQGAEVNLTTDKGNAPLHLASIKGHTEVTKLLIQQGAEVNLTTDKGNAPLHLACTKGHTGVTTLLIQQGAEVNLTTDKGNAPLHLASIKGHTEVTKLLIQQGAEVNLTTDKGNAPLHLACTKGHTGVTTLLIQQGAEVNLTTDKGNAPLHLACTKGHTGVTTLLIQQGAEANLKNDRKWTPLHKACCKGHTGVIRLLIQQGTEVNLTTDNGNTSLHLACTKGHTDVIKLLIQQGAEVNLKNGSGDTPLHDACWKGHTEVTTLLIQQGAEVNLKNGSGDAPLHMACNGGHTEVTKLLIQQGAEVNLMDDRKWTPLHEACSQGHSEISSLLVQHGADVTMKTKQGWTPDDIARHHGHWRLRSILHTSVHMCRIFS